MHCLVSQTLCILHAAMIGDLSMYSAKLKPVVDQVQLAEVLMRKGKTLIIHFKEANPDGFRSRLIYLFFNKLFTDIVQLMPIITTNKQFF